MTRDEFISEIRKTSATMNFHQAMSGSKYITINGLKFRISDHYQPSHYQMQNHIDVENYEQIIDYLKTNNLWNEVPYNREDFIQLYLNGCVYESYKIKQKGEYFHNGFGLFVDTECAANNLWFELFKYNNSNDKN